MKKLPYIIRSTCNLFVFVIFQYHGGTNFGRTAGGPYIVTTYDYDAPLDEYGNLRQPKWGHLKKLHEILYSMEKVLTSGERSSVKLANGVWVRCFLLVP